ncbi:hypothetical protein I317_00952 [Kwoniella heveanensis CBS 569]|nr:hypothetical protein I317_00952 [Kwoniella heveanensis CBS 569]
MTPAPSPSPSSSSSPSPTIVSSSTGPSHPTQEFNSHIKPSCACPLSTAEHGYPTPPPSPVITHSTILPPLVIEARAEPSTTDCLPNLAAVPIPLLLDTEHHLPHAAGLRLVLPDSLLELLAGVRKLDCPAPTDLWERMPYSPATATTIARTANAMEEDHVESLIGGQRPEAFMQGLQKAMRRQKSTEHISSIFVHPPTPERIISPTSEDPPVTRAIKVAASNTVPNGSRESSREASPMGSPILASKTLPALNANGMPIPLQVLPEVRSPPKKTIAMTTDSLQLSAKRGRRPRLFGFTEMPEGLSSSATSSAASSPDRTPPAQHHARWAEHTNPAASSFTNAAATSSTPSPATFIPRRHPVRARSEAALMTSVHHIPPRRRENGLKLNFDGIIPLPQPAEIQSATIPSPYSSKLIRKKSGEILKSALKYGGPLQANGTPVHDQQERPRFESKSCPSTPSCPKYVHFDAQLERVKLFLHDQKPQVVSRDGSPTADTTSEGDEFPFPSTDEERDVRKVLQVTLPNFPTSHPPDSDLYLESLFLDDDRKSLKGVIVCKNIAYQKWVAVRFTFDWWQTTSEVSATYKESIRGGSHDRFVFSVKLNDMLSRIEEKTLFMAIRYNAEGREIWDSNGGQNYQVLFQKVAPAPTGLRAARNSVSIQPGMGKAVGGRTSQWSVTGGNNDDRLADLRAKLDRLTADEPDRVPVSPNSSRYFSFDFGSRRSSGSSSNGSRRNSEMPSSPNGSPMRSFSNVDAKTSDLPAAGPALAARYDFGAALKTTTRRNSNSPVGRVAELPDVKTGLLNYGKVNNGHAATEFYSPRFNDPNLPNQDYFFSPTNTSNATMPMAVPVPDVKIEGPSPPVEDSERSTPTPTEPVGTVPAPKPVLPQRPTASFHRLPTYPPKFTIGDDSVEVSPNVSPPQLVSSSSADSTSTETPSESPRSPPDVSFAKWSPTAKSGDSSDDAASLASYSSFIEQFCWGGNGGIKSEQRSHSTSSLDNYFADSPGLSTPRALNPASNGTSGVLAVDMETPSSTSSYYTTYTNTPTTREDIENIDQALGSGHRSPPVMC